MQLSSATTTSAVTPESIALTREAILKGQEELAKAGWMQPTGTPTQGPQNYDLEPGAKSLFPVLTPLRNRIARRSANGGIQANWKAFTAINTLGLDAGVSDGNRGAAVTTSFMDYFAAYRSIGLEDYVTWQAGYAADHWLDLRARAQTNLLWALMIAEEKLDLGGNTSLALGQPTAPGLADQGTGGTLSPNTAYSVIVAPLSLQGFLSANLGTSSAPGYGVRGSVTRVNMDGSSDIYGGGTGKLSANTIVTTANDGHTTHAISATTAQIPGAMGYAWFIGPAGSEALAAVTSVNSVVIAAAAFAGAQTAVSLGTADNSTNGLVYDGILTQVVKAGGYFTAQATGVAGTGTPLTADGVGGIAEIDAALQWFWDNYRLSPDTLWVSSQEQRNITRKVLAGSSAGAQRFVINVEQGQIKGGDLVVSYLNKFGMNGAKALDIKLHPNMPAGTILFDTNKLPYPMNDVEEILIKRCRQDYFSTVWPMTKRRYEYGDYFDGVLQNYFPPAFGIITNIGNG